jgi:hypothetical protein
LLYDSYQVTVVGVVTWGITLLFQGWEVNLFPRLEVVVLLFGFTFYVVGPGYLCWFPFAYAIVDCYVTLLV